MITLSKLSEGKKYTLRQTNRPSDLGSIESTREPVELERSLQRWNCPHLLTLPNFSSPACACEAWPFGYVKQALPLRGLGVVLLLSSLELATLFPRTGSIAYSGPNRRCNRCRCRRRRQVGYRCLSKTPTTLRIERSLASIDETRGKGCHPSCGIEQRLLGLGC